MEHCTHTEHHLLQFLWPQDGAVIASLGPQSAVHYFAGDLHHRTHLGCNVFVGSSLILCFILQASSVTSGFPSSWGTTLPQIHGTVPAAISPSLVHPNFASGGIPSYACQLNAMNSSGFPVQWSNQTPGLPAQHLASYQPGMGMQAFPSATAQKAATIPSSPK